MYQLRSCLSNLLHILLIYNFRLRQIDVQTMKKLHNKVNIVPLIAKADILTKDELKRMKNRVSNCVESGDSVFELDRTFCELDRTVYELDRTVCELGRTIYELDWSLWARSNSLWPRSNSLWARSNSLWARSKSLWARSKFIEYNMVNTGSYESPAICVLKV